MPNSPVRLSAFVAFGIVAALVLIAVVIPAAVAAGIAAFLVGYVLGLSNLAIGWIGLATAVPISIAVILWIWPDVAALALDTAPPDSIRNSP